MPWETTPQLLDAVLVIVALEFAVLAIWLRRQGKADRIAAVFFFLVSGAALIFAARLALADGSSALLGVAMLTAFACHFVTLLFLIGPANSSSHTTNAADIDVDR